MRFDRLLRGAALLALVVGYGGNAGAEEITVLTWNHASLAETYYNPAIAEFEAAHPGVKVKWLDRKGTEFNAFLQTQMVANATPDVVEFQGMLWLEYQDKGLIENMAPYLAKEPDVAARFDPKINDYWGIADGQWALPAQWGTTLLHYSIPAFKAAGISGPPKTWDEFMDYVARTTDPSKQQVGFISLNFDWAFWPMLATNGIELLNEDMTKAAFNTPKMKEVVTALADATAKGQISKTSWTGRWVEPNGEFADGRDAMYLAFYSSYSFFKSASKWVSPETLGTAQWPGGWTVPSPQAWSIMKDSKHPDLAWEFVKLMTSKKWAAKYGQIYALLSGNKEADAENVEYFKKNDPSAAEVLEANLGALDKITGAWKTPKNAEILSVFWPEIQSALLGQKSVEDALNAAERQVNRVLER